ncbi:hypothetical protein E2N92_06835 [Methanofollis formosanus]|uniref:Transglutaminase-like domain-containing protein n=1 Tax=Methanofollis formosanus TaxID=299308 RepID=A0A8G1EFV4_9EURY|nr:transglutaminase-like domain-containing protein [Methanofollis formosanus]QYZ79168.1 hypothetical protein E2N92_06835 [Methanofollis formosanus]
MDRQDMLSVLIGVVIVLVVALVVKPALYGGSGGGADTPCAIQTPIPAPEISRPTLAPAPSHDGGEDLVREFRWTAIDGGVHTATLKIPLSLFERERQTPRIQDPSAWGRYALSEDDSPYVRELAEKIASSPFNVPENDYYQVMDIIFFVQQLPYALDNATESYTEGRVPPTGTYAGEEVEYPKYPVETLVDGKGDCEDSSILTAALLNQMDYDVVLLHYSDHLAVGVQIQNFDPYYVNYTPKYYDYRGKRYYYVETTGYKPIPNPISGQYDGGRWGKPFPVGDAQETGIGSVGSEKPRIIPLHYLVVPAHHTIRPAHPVPGGEG